MNLGWVDFVKADGKVPPQPLGFFTRFVASEDLWFLKNETKIHNKDRKESYKLFKVMNSILQLQVP